MDFFGQERVVGEAVKLFREVAVATLVRQATEGVIPCAQIEILADQHAGAFRRMLSERLDDSPGQG